jgi:hypothetical protein
LGWATTALREIRRDWDDHPPAAAERASTCWLAHERTSTVCRLRVDLAASGSMPAIVVGCFRLHLSGDARA